MELHDEGRESGQKWVLHLVSHTHWDREWYMSFQRFRRRFVKLMDHLLDLFAEKKEYRHFTLDGQVLVLKDYLEIRPERREQIKQMVQAGRLLIGPWYSQPNEFMASGEALIRNLMLGYRECETLGGVMRICYLPDAFGHISQLPQIARGFGMGDIVVWRGLPRGSKTVFEWSGADGSECLVFYMYGAYGNALALPLSEESFTEYIDATPIERPGLVERVNGIIAALEPKATTPNLLLMNGIDHSFAQDDLPEVIDRINQRFPDLRAIHSSLPHYARAVREDHERKSVAFTRVSGELRDPSESSILPGSQSTRSLVKKTNSQIEGLFEKWMEPFAAFAWVTGAPYPAAMIWKAWEYLLQNHAHDSMACSSVDPTYHQVMTRFEWAQEIGEEIAGESLQILCNQISPDESEREKTVVVFNSLNWTRNEVVTTTLDIPKAMRIRNPGLIDGDREVPLFVHHKRDNVVIRFNPRRGIPDGIPVDRYEVSFKPGDIPGNGYRALKLVDRGRPAWYPDTLIKNHRTMENEYLRVEIRANGTLDVTDRRSGRRFESLHFFEDSGEAGEGFSHVAPLADTTVNSTGARADITIVEDSALKATFKVDITIDLPAALTGDRTMRKESTVPCAISSLITLTAGVPRIDIETRVDNRARDHRLRVIFPAGIETDYSWAEQPFDVVKRGIRLPDLNDYPGEKPSPAHPQLSFVDVSDGQDGLMIANQGIYEYEVVDNEDRSIALTLLRCTDRLHFGHFFHSEETRIPEAQCIGEHSFRYSIIPHQGGWEAAYRQAREFRFPLKAVRGCPLEEERLTNYGKAVVDVLPPVGSFLRVEPVDLEVTAVKKHEVNDSLVVRLFNPDEKPVKGRINAGKGRFALAYSVNLNEERQQELSVDNDGWVDIEVGSKGLYTVEMVRPARSLRC